MLSPTFISRGVQYQYHLECYRYVNTNLFHCNLLGVSAFAFRTIFTHNIDIYNNSNIDIQYKKTLKNIQNQMFFFFQILSLMFSYSILIWIYILKRSFIVNFGISDVVVLVMKILKTPFLFSSLKFILPLKRMHDLSLNKLKKSPFHLKCSSCISQLCRILSFFFFLQINAVARKRR